MRTRFPLILLAAAAVLAAGCAAKRHREYVAEANASYWRDSGVCTDPNCAECNQDATGNTNETGPVGSSVFDRYNPFKKQSGQVATDGSLTCEGCNRQSDVLMDGRCVDCLKQRIDDRVLGVQNGTQTKPIDKVSSANDVPQVKMPVRLPTPLVPSQIVVHDSVVEGSRATDQPSSASERAEIGRDGGSFVPDSSSSSGRRSKPVVESRSDAGSELESRKSPLAVVDRLPEKKRDRARTIEMPDSASEPGDDDVPEKVSAEDQTDELADAKARPAKPQSEPFQLDQLLPKILNPPTSGSGPEAPAVDSNADEDDIQWGPPIPVKARLPRQNSPNTAPQRDTSDEDQPPPSEPPPNFQQIDNRSSAAPLKRSERDIIRDLRNSTVPNSIVFDNTPAIPEQQVSEKKILLTAKPVPGYHELQQIAADRNMPPQNQTPSASADPLEQHSNRTRAMTVSSRKVRSESEFDFQSLPELDDPTNFGLDDPANFNLGPADPNALIEEIFEPIPSPVSADRNQGETGSGTPVTVQGDLKLINPHSLKARLPMALPAEKKFLLRAVPEIELKPSDSGTESKTGSRANFQPAPADIR